MLAAGLHQIGFNNSVQALGLRISGLLAEYVLDDIGPALVVLFQIQKMFFLDLNDLPLLGNALESAAVVCSV